METPTLENPAPTCNCSFIDIKAVAQGMHVSERAIESQKYRIVQKISIHDRVRLTRFAIREGLMPA